MTLTDTQRFIARADLVVEAIDDQIVILDLEGDRCFGLNAQGVLLWQHLRDNHASLVELSDALQQAYAIDAERARADASAFVIALRDAGLIDEQS
ncbi:PqqD family protein [Lujinxingia litoralis]|uniref:PqqD family protein n=1 Tax=Lujinxingia litoralis TaxID=2211119 RepID=A0A328CCR9_9DELT|nr:PqqD family protein [Lujinxingia litoralis]RAL25051.1 PqqD family protein [Lujinxingia litoralis]